MTTGRAGDITTLLVREIRGLQRELALFPDDESIWRTAPGVTNPAGTLARHVAGNLQHYIGAVLGGTGYQRDRVAEFTSRDGSRADLTAELDIAAEVVRTVLADLPAERYDEPYPDALVPGLDLPTGRFLLHLCTHAACHLGQAGYLRRIVTGDARSADPVALRALGPST